MTVEIRGHLSKVQPPYSESHIHCKVVLFPNLLVVQRAFSKLTNQCSRTNSTTLRLPLIEALMLYESLPTSIGFEFLTALFFNSSGHRFCRPSAVR